MTLKQNSQPSPELQHYAKLQRTLWTLLHLQSDPSDRTCITEATAEEDFSPRNSTTPA